MEHSNRRQFLAGAGSSLGAAWIAANWPAIASAHTHAAAAALAGNARLEVLNPEEARDVEAIAAQIIPTDDTPGAREAGALYFIDRSLHTWAASAAPTFRAGLLEFRARFAATHATTFAAADETQQIEFLSLVETGAFFGTVRFLTLAGMFVSPSYGGNRDGIGWRLIGFDDTHGYSPPFGYYDRDYPGFVPPPESA
jgi:gluconate 2-dehydrogenase gamma chain